MDWCKRGMPPVPVHQHHASLALCKACIQYLVRPVGLKVYPYCKVVVFAFVCNNMLAPYIYTHTHIYIYTVKCHYNACHYSANASLTRSILGSQTAPTSWHALMTVPEWLSTWAKGVKSSRSDRPQRQWHLFVPIQLEQNKRIPPAGHVNTVDSWLIFDQTHWLFISDALRMPPFGQYGC